MLIFEIDDEATVLEDARYVIRRAAPEAEVLTFSRAAPALEAVSGEGLRPDVVFCDIEMPGMNGLEFAARLKAVSPETKLVFVTSYTEYALDAFRLHAQGYLLKPPSVDAVREELTAILPPPVLQPDKLRIQCFGHFEVFWQGKPLIFERKQTKELLAFLIDREGALCTPEQISDSLWEGEYDLAAAKHRIRNLISDLRKTLRSAGMENVLIRERRQLAIRCDLVDCDYYRMLAGDMAAVNSYRGEYMLDYSWAELTAGWLYFHKAE